MTIDGCPADCADGKAESSLFNTGFEAAIGIQVGLAADNVEVTSVTVTKETGVVAGTRGFTSGPYFLFIFWTINRLFLFILFIAVNITTRYLPFHTKISIHPRLACIDGALCIEERWR